MGEQGAVMEQASADSRAQGDDEFHPPPLMTAQPCMSASFTIRVVSWPTSAGATEVESLPLGGEVGIWGPS